jgi:hypothetical protein
VSFGGNRTPRIVAMPEYRCQLRFPRDVIGINIVPVSSMLSILLFPVSLFAVGPDFFDGRLLHQGTTDKMPLFMWQY